MKRWRRTIVWAVLLCLWVPWLALNAWWHDWVTALVAAVGILTAAWGLWVSGYQMALELWGESLGRIKAASEPLEVAQQASAAHADWIRRYVGRGE